MFRTSCPVCFGARWTLSPPPAKRPDWVFVPTGPLSFEPTPDGSWTCVGCGGTGTVGWNRCPKSSSDEETRELVTLWSRYRDGFTPAPGSWGEQTVFVAEAFGIAALEWSRIEERKREDTD